MTFHCNVYLFAFSWQVFERQSGGWFDKLLEDRNKLSTTIIILIQWTLRPLPPPAPAPGASRCAARPAAAATPRVSVARTAAAAGQHAGRAVNEPSRSFTVPGEGPFLFKSAF